MQPFFMVYICISEYANHFSWCIYASPNMQPFFAVHILYIYASPNIHFFTWPEIAMFPTVAFPA